MATFDELLIPHPPVIEQKQAEVATGDPSYADWRTFADQWGKIDVPDPTESVPELSIASDAVPEQAVAQGENVLASGMSSEDIRGLARQLDTKWKTKRDDDEELAAKASMQAELALMNDELPVEAVSEAAPIISAEQNEMLSMQFVAERYREAKAMVLGALKGLLPERGEETQPESSGMLMSLAERHPALKTSLSALLLTVSLSAVASDAHAGGWFSKALQDAGRSIRTGAGDAVGGAGTETRRVIDQGTADAEHRAANKTGLTWESREYQIRFDTRVKDAIDQLEQTRQDYDNQIGKSQRLDPSSIQDLTREKWVALANIAERHMSSITRDFSPNSQETWEGLRANVKNQSLFDDFTKLYGQYTHERDRENADAQQRASAGDTAVAKRYSLRWESQIASARQDYKSKKSDLAIELGDKRKSEEEKTKIKMSGYPKIISFLQNALDNYDNAVRDGRHENGERTIKTTEKTDEDVAYLKGQLASFQAVFEKLSGGNEDEILGLGKANDSSHTVEKAAADAALRNIAK